MLIPVCKCDFNKNYVVIFFVLISAVLLFVRVLVVISGCGVSRPIVCTGKTSVASATAAVIIVSR